MNKNELIDRVADRTGLRKKEAGLVVTAVFACMTEALAQGEKVSVAGFGIMELRHRAARTGHLPINHREIEIPAARVPVFRPAKQLKEKVNQ